MVKFIIETFGIGLAAGISAAVYYAVLRKEWPVNLMARFFNDNEGKAWTKPLWFCEKCISGQLGLWSYVILVVMPGILTSLGQEPAFWSPSLSYIQNPFAYLLGALFAICISIFTGMFCTRGLTILQNTHA